MKQSSLDRNKAECCATIPVQQQQDMMIKGDGQQALHLAAHQNNRRCSNGGAFYRQFSLGKKLGDGTYASVRRATHKNTGEKYAVKIVNAKTAKQTERIEREVAILQSLEAHPNILQLLQVYRSQEVANKGEEQDQVAITTRYFLVTEELKGGELFDRILQKTCYNELEARDICRGIVEAIHHCHAHQIAHRDIKPENLLLASRDSDTNVKLADFGFARQCSKPRSLMTYCGTPAYMAPEIIRRKAHDTQVDMWSLGVVAFCLLGGYSPFQQAQGDDSLLKQVICQGQYEFHEVWWKHVSEDAKSFVSGLLKVRRGKRMTAVQALKHPWLANDDSFTEDDLSSRDLGLNLSNLRESFKAEQRKSSEEGATPRSLIPASLLGELERLSFHDEQDELSPSPAVAVTHKARAA